MNLLPRETKDELKAEYKKRYAVFLLLFISFAAFIGVIAMTPQAFSLGVSYFSMKNSPVMESEQSEEDKKISEEIKSLREEIRVLNPGTAEIFFTDIAGKVSEELSGGVSITSMTMSVESPSVRRIILSGVSDDRESLVSFSQKLRSDDFFTSVELPVSNLSKKSDIDFSLVLTIETKKQDQ